MTTTLKALSSDTIRLIGSTQVVTSVSSVVKELIENSIDAGATNIDVKLENYGSDCIEIKDNGKGIPEKDIPYLAKRHYTSKISAFTDLEELVTYGFRGEALASLCSVSEMTVTTRTAGEAVARSLVLNATGDIVSTKYSPQPEGTTVSASKLFKNLPVRQQYNKNDKRRKEELKKVENLVTAFGIINPKIRLTLRHNKDVLWQKAAVDCIRSALRTAWGYNAVQLLEHLQQSKEDPQVSVEMFVPKSFSDMMIMSKTGGDQGFVYVNKRPVNLKYIQKVIRQYYCNCQSCETNRYPLFVVSITIPQREVDINLDPNKTQVLIHNDDIVMDIITILLESVYGPLGSVPTKKAACESKSGKTNPPEMTDNIQDAPKILNNNYLKISPALEEDTSPLPRPPQNATFPDLSESNIKSPLQDLSDKSKEIDFICELDKSDDHSDASKPEKLCIPPSHSPEKAPSNSNCFLLELSTNPVDQQSQTNSTSDIKETSTTTLNSGNDLGADLNLGNDLGADLHPKSPSLASTKPDDTCDSDIYDQLIGSFNLETPVLAEPASKNNTPKLSQEDLRAADFLDSFVEPMGGEIWCQGKMKSADGNLVQPVQLFAPSSHHTPGKRPPSPTSDLQLAPLAKKKAVEPRVNFMEGQTTMYDLVQSQPVKRPETAFVIFSKQIRPKIMEENPDADYKLISELVVKRWKSLTDEEKAEFKNLCDKDLKRYEEEMNLAKDRAAHKIINGKTKLSVKEKHGHTPAREKLRKASKLSIPPPLKRRCIKVQTVQFSIAQLKEKLSNEYNSSQCSWMSVDRLVPIGYIPSRDVWVCHQGARLVLLNPHRVDEVLIYQRLMESFQVNADPLENPILLNHKLPGGERILKTLMSLKREDHAICSYQIVTDQRLTANGFTVAIYKEKSDQSSEECQVEITGLTSSVPMYGMKDLHEVLENIATIGPSTSLMQSRPLKVVNLLKSEAVRMARSSPPFSSRNDVSDLIERFSTNRKWKCLHDRPFLHDIYSLSDLPFSQESLLESQQSVS